MEVFLGGVEENFAKKLWNLRGKLDDILLNKEYIKLNKIRMEYIKFCSGALTKNNSAFLGYNNGFFNESSRLAHLNNNKVAILETIEAYISKYCNGEQNVQTKLKTNNINCFAFDIWILREMFDCFVNNYKTKAVPENENLLLGRAILNRLRFLNSSIEESGNLYLKDIINEVQIAYGKMYGKKSPKIDYQDLSKDYIM